jgi:hypothetical protein
MSKRDWLWVLLGWLFFLLVNYPLLQIFNANILMGGVALMALYLFGIWVGAIVLLVIFTRQRPSG